jgi:hypothetical protein
VHDERRWVEALLDALASSPGKPRNPALHELLARLPAGAKGLSGAMLDDMSSPFIAIPSRGLIMNIAEGPQPIEASFIYRSPQQARQAARAIEKRASSPDLDPVIRSFIPTMHPVVRGDAVAFQIDGQRMVDPAFMSAVEAALKRTAAAAKKP